MYRLLFIVALLLSGALNAWAQPVAKLEVDAITVRTEQRSRDARVDLFVSIPFNYLTFLSTGDAFTSSYEITADIYRVNERNQRRGLVQTRIWEAESRTSRFASTRSERMLGRTSNSVQLPPGRYLVDLRLRDRASDKTYSESTNLNVRDLSGPLAISDAILIQEYSRQANSITPIVGASVDTEAGRFRLFYEVYADEDREVAVRQQVLRLSTGGQGFMRSILGLGRDSDIDGGDVSYQREQLRRLPAGRTPVVVDIPMTDLKAGEYLIRLDLLDERGEIVQSTERPVTVRWSGLDEHIRDLDEAVNQLQYIAKREEIANIRSASSHEERLARFREFWDKRDPTPDTARNERMEEYYYRIDFANRQFSHIRDGWKTDRGHATVLFGEPDLVERPDGQGSRPYEIWYYYRIGRRLVFIDRKGGGDYELMVPIWDERTRIR